MAKTKEVRPSHTASLNGRDAEDASETKNKKTLDQSPRQSSRRTANKSTVVLQDDDGLGNDDIFATDYRKPGQYDDDYVEEDEHDGDDDFEKMEVKPASAASGQSSRRKNANAAESADVAMNDAPAEPKSASRTGQKRKSAAIDRDGDYEDCKTSKGPARTRAIPSAPAAKKQRGVATKKDEPERDRKSVV